MSLTNKYEISVFQTKQESQVFDIMCTLTLFFFFFFFSMVSYGTIVSVNGTVVLHFFLALDKNYWHSLWYGTVPDTVELTVPAGTVRGSLVFLKIEKSIYYFTSLISNLIAYIEITIFSSYL